MDVQLLLEYFQRYGAVFIFAVVFLEYLNLPGFPAGVILPLSGLMASLGRIGFILAILVTVAAGLLGSLALYGLGRAGGHVFLNWFYKKFPKKRDTIDKYIGFVQAKGFWGICRKAYTDDTYAGIDTGRSDENGAFKVYGQLCTWNFCLEYGFHSNRLFCWRIDIQCDFIAWGHNYEDCDVHQQL